MMTDQSEKSNLENNKDQSHSKDDEELSALLDSRYFYIYGILYKT